MTLPNQFLGKSSGLYYKTSVVVIYNCNDSGLYYKTTILHIYNAS